MITMVAMIAVAAFLIVICMVTIIALKKESKRRADGIKTIEKSISRMSQELARGIKEGNEITMDMSADIIYAIETSASGANVKENEDISDDYDIIGSDFNMDMNIDLQEDVESPESIGEISFDFLETDEFAEEDTFVPENEINGAMSRYITGRSGRKYTAEELEKLIKE